MCQLFRERLRWFFSVDRRIASIGRKRKDQYGEEEEEEENESLLVRNQRREFFVSFGQLG